MFDRMEDVRVTLPIFVLLRLLAEGPLE